MLGLVENLDLHGYLLATAKVYVGILAATILFIATNAGVIGASRITYAMSSHRQLPEMFRRLHPKLKTPWLALIVFGAIGPTIFILSGKVDFLGRMYAFGAMLSFTIAHASIVALRVRAQGGSPIGRRGRTSRIGGIDWPLFAIVGGLGTGAAWLVVVVQDAPTRYAGFAWLAAGFVFYVLYRRSQHLPLTTTMRAPVPLGAALALEYRSILVPIVAGDESREAVELAARLATERAGRIVLLRVVVVPLELPLDADLTEELEDADELLDEARAVAEPYGVRVVERVVRARNAGRAIIEEAERRGAEIIVLGARRGQHRTIFGDTVDFVLKHSPSRVMVAAGKTVRMSTYKGLVTFMALAMILLGLTMLTLTLVHGFGVGVILGVLFVAAGVGRLLLLRRSSGVARKLPGLRRELDARALFSVAYGEIASSIYFALGIVAAHALGFTPLVLLGRRRALPDRLALLRRRHSRSPRDGRCRDVRAPRVERPRRVPDRLGALPRLPDRDRALGALPAALPLRRARSARRSTAIRGTSSSRSR